MSIEKIKISLFTLLVALSPNMVSAQGLDVASISTMDNTTLAVNAVQAPVTVPVLNLNRGYLEEAEIAIGTVLKSYHFNKYDYHDYNETHDGVYLSLNRWSAGKYRNSADVQSTFVTYNPSLYQSESFKINLVTGVANGYEGWEHAQGDYLLVLGVSAQWKYLKTMLAPDAVAFGLELPLN